MSADLSNRQPPLWRWPEVASALTGSAQPGPDIVAVRVDSRLIEAGDLFVALPGDPGPRFNPSYRSEVDGHDFVAAAQANGAVGAVVHRSVDGTGDFPLIQVDDTYDALWELGKAGRSRLAGVAVAVTGSSGKTTAKRFLQAALDAYAPPGSFNNHIGVPLALINTPALSRAAVYEIGTNHPGEIQPLAELAAPDMAIVLNVHTAHIENFSSWQALKNEKLSIFNAIDDKSSCVSEDVLEVGFGFCFGKTGSAHARLVDLQHDLARIDLFGETHSVRVPGGGEHRATTAAATLLCAKLLDFDLAPALDLPDDVIPQGRGNLVAAGRHIVVDESYNANPQSMAAAIGSFRRADVPQKLVIIGEMLELGEAAPGAHMELAPLLVEFDEVICVGAGTRELAAKLGVRWFADAGDELLQATVRTVSQFEAGAGIMVKGSNRVFWAERFVSRLADDLNN